MYLCWVWPLAQGLQHSLTQFMAQSSHLAVLESNQLVELDHAQQYLLS